MEILNPNEIKEQEDESLNQAKDRTEKLSTAENHLAISINLSKKNAEEEIEKINKEVEDFEIEKEADKKIITQEIKTLESQRKELMKPIDEIEQQAKDKLEMANLRAVEVEKEAVEVKQQREDNMDDAEKNQDRSQSLDEREEDLNRRENGIKNEETQMKISAETLKNNWIEYHETVDKLNIRIEAVKQSEATIVTENQAIQSRKEAQDEREKDLYRQRTELRSNYQALEQAKEHLNLK